MKKLVSIMLVLVMVLSLVPSAFAAEVSAADKFTDVPANAWYLDELNYAVANGYISGTSSTTFSPDATITRGQFVTILGRMLNVSTSGGNTKFTDVDAGSWYAPYVAWAAQNGYVNGTSSTTFSPEATITVEQMGVIVSNYISKSGVDLSGYTASAAYKDSSSISSWAVSSMELMQQYGLLVTDVSGNVNPHKSVNRAEGTVSLVRLAKATGLGVEPVIEQKPASGLTSLVNQPVLTGRGITYADLVPGNPQFIANFAPDDYTSLESTALYMLKNDVSEVKVDYNIEDTWNADVRKFSNMYSDICDGCGFRSASDGSNSLVFFANIVGADGDCPALETAIKVHDNLWASGAITSSMTQKQKARVYYDWLIQHCEYNNAASNMTFEDLMEQTVIHITPDTPWEVLFGGSAAPKVCEPAKYALIDGKAVCTGYTAAYNLLLRLEGIECGAVYSPAEDHDWSIAVLDGVQYHIDATWGDTSGTADKYFCMTPEASLARFK